MDLPESNCLQIPGFLLLNFLQKKEWRLQQLRELVLQLKADNERPRQEQAKAHVGPSRVHLSPAHGPSNPVELYVNSADGVGDYCPSWYV